MARFTGGWYKLHRNILDKDLFQNIHLWALWHYLLSIANYKESQLLCNGQQRILKPGQLAFSPRKLADTWDVNHMTIWKWLKYLRDTERLVYETYTRGTVVTICNWTQYQDFDETEYTPSIHEVDTKYTPAIRQVALSEESKNVRKKERKNIVGIRLDYPPEFDALWQAYGRRGDKKAAYEVYQSLRLTSDEYVDLQTAIKNYAQEQPELKYRKHLDRFFKSDWREKLKSAPQNLISMRRSIEDILKDDNK